MGAVCLIVIGAVLGRKIPVPNAVLWSLLGFGIGFVPGFEAVRLDPRMTLYLLLPPLIYSSSVQLPWPEFRDNLRPIALLAFWLVLVNTLAVAVTAHMFAGFPWGMAVALGAVVSPTDPVAASAVAPRVGLPNKLVAILEGEGLVNDAVALTVLRVAIAAAATGAFSITGGLERFFAILIGEPLYGWAVGIAMLALRARIVDPRIEITLSLLTPFAAYLVPEHLGGSGILATVAAGMYVGELKSAVVSAGTRLSSTSVWDVVVFLLNGSLFLMAGLELRRVIRPENLESPILLWGLLVALTVVLVRAGWCAAMWLGFRGRRILSSGGEHMPGGHMVVIAWSGMRGPVSLAAALSIPGFATGLRLPHFDALVFITAIVIVVTLLVQGTTLPEIAGAFCVLRDAERDRREEMEQFALGEEETARAAIECVSQLERDGRVPRELANRLRQHYRDRLEGIDLTDGAGRDVRLILIDAERARIRDLRKQGRIGDRTVERLEHTLDLRESTVWNS